MLQLRTQINNTFIMAQKEKQPSPPEADFHGAAIVGENGEEVPITEDMVKSACEELDAPEGNAGESS